MVRRGSGGVGGLQLLAHLPPGGLAWRQQELWPGTGNRESFRRSFFSRDSIILWTLKTWRPNRERYLRDMADPTWQHIRFVRLRNQRETEAFLTQLMAEKAQQSTA